MTHRCSDFQRRSGLWVAACAVGILLGACGAPAPPAGSQAPAGNQPEPARTEAAPSAGTASTAPAAAPAATGSVKAPTASLTAMKEHALEVRAYGGEEPSRCGLQAPRGAGSGGSASAVQVFFGCTPQSGPVVGAVPARVVTVPSGQRPERVALEALLAGPTEQERQAGYLSTFGSGSRGVAFETEIRSDGTAVVNFDQSIREKAKAFVSNIDTRQIVATLGQFPGVERVLILVEGDPLCRALGEC